LDGVRCHDHDAILNTGHNLSRLGEGSAGARSPAFDTLVYRDRNTVERGYARLKQWRGIATPYDKYALTFGGGALLAAIAIDYRVHD
jgi:putative transposase